MFPLLVALLSSLGGPHEPAIDPQHGGAPDAILDKHCCPSFAFGNRPLVQHIEKEEEDCASAGEETGCRRLFFLQPAYFHDTRYDLAGAPFDEEGVTIHEGMSLTVFPSGKYRVRMTLTAPDTALTLRMWLQIVDRNLTVHPHSTPALPSPILLEPETHGGLVALPQGINLTLPPIQRLPQQDRLDLGSTPLPNQALSTFNVQVTGHSPALRDWFAKYQWTETMELRRDGTALIGSRPAR